MSVVGYDDGDGSAHFVPPLTTVAQELVRVEALQVDRILAAPVAVSVQGLEDPGAEVNPLPPVPCRALDLRVDARAAARRAVEPLHHLDFRLQCGNAKAPCFRREPSGVHGRAVGAAPLVHVQRFELREIEVPRVIAAVLPVPSRETRGDVGDTVEVEIDGIGTLTNQVAEKAQR